MKLINIKLFLLFIATAGSSLAVMAEDRFKENGHYQRVESAFTKTVASSKSKKSDKKIEVVEFFLYSCPHCYELEPKLEAWRNKHKEKVSFKRIPAVLTPNWGALAKAYYIAEKFNILDKSHEELFKSIHNDKKVYLSEYALAEFFVKYGIKKNDFITAFNSKEIIEKVGEARRLSVKYKFRGVPIVVINDEFKTAPFYNKSQKEMLEVMDFLLTKTQTKTQSIASQ